MSNQEQSGQSVSDVRTIEEFIELALRFTRERLADLGMSDEALLDPEGSIDQQVATLRCIFLEAERSCLPFNAYEDRFWRVMRARLQPVVLAYLTHEKFVQTLDVEARELRPDTLMNVYKDRLNNSDRFRSFFFDLDKRLKQEAMTLFSSEPEAESGDQQTSRSTEYDANSSKAQIERNILASLEKQLQDLEKKYNQQEKALKKAQEDNFGLNNSLDDRDERIAALKREKSTLEEQNAQLRLASDANQRTGHYEGARGAEASEQDDSLGSMVLDADQESLLLKIESLERELTSTSDAAYNAFMANSDLGIVVLFMLTSFRCISHEQLGAELVRSVTTFGLKPIVGIKKANSYVFFPETGASESLKSQLHSKISSGKTVETPHLMLFEDSCCILVENPPKEDAERYARLKDNLGTLMRGVQARYEGIMAENAAQRQKSQVDALIIRSNEVFRTFEQNLEKKKGKTSQIINMLGQEMRKSLGIAPGDSKSIRLNMDLKKLEDSLAKVYVQSELIDPAFRKNISKVAATLLNKNKQ